MNTNSPYLLAAARGEDSSTPADVAAEAFAAALRNGNWREAELQLDAAATLEGGDATAWALRRSDWYLAQQRWDEADSQLKRLVVEETLDELFQTIVRHKLASIAFMRRDYTGCVAWLSPLLEVDGVAKPLSRGFRTVEILWVRALHLSSATDRLYRWVAQLDAFGQLDPAVAGVASLASWERGDLASAKRWLAMGRLVRDTESAECLLTAAFIAMSEGAPQAELRVFADEVRAKWPADGRAWAMLGIVDLLAGDGKSAELSLERATTLTSDYAPAWRGLGWVQIILGKSEDAEQSFLAALKLNSRHSESHGGLAISLAMQQRESEARECLLLYRKMSGRGQIGEYAESLFAGEFDGAWNFRESAINSTLG